MLFLAWPRRSFYFVFVTLASNDLSFSLSFHYVSKSCKVLDTNNVFQHFFVTLFYLKKPLFFLTYFFSVIQFSNNNGEIIKISGGDEESRTPDPLLARQVLSQLSYTPILTWVAHTTKIIIPQRFWFVKRKIKKNLKNLFFFIERTKTVATKGGTWYNAVML